MGIMRNNIKPVEFTEDYSNILESEIIGYDGYSERKGTVDHISIQEHSILGKLVQIWVKWEGQEKQESFFPRQLNKYIEGNRQIGVYVI